MTTILGIDAAWTAGEPSGVALVRQQGSRWRCFAAAPSYASFLDSANGGSPDWTRRAIGSVPDPARLLSAAAHIAGEPAALVAIDMPVSTVPILGRRAADRQVSRTFGAQWCSAHTPSPIRPGSIGADLSRHIAATGYPLATAATPPGTPGRLVEVYPHPALLALLKRDRRVPYKIAKASNYWKGASIPERIDRLLAEFAAILGGLAIVIDGIAIPLPNAADVGSLSALKPLEDAIDALVCCWVGVEYLAGRCQPLGDDTAAIWCPRA